MSEWVKWIFEKQIKDIPEFIIFDFAGDLEEKVIDKIQATFDPEMWEQFDKEEIRSYVEEALWDVVENVETSEEDQEVIGIYFNKIITFLAGNF